ncbi:MAG: sulfate/molybdate ABC transporter ATP-binding protein [Phenylobacterium sp.]|uniref:sulfate/molybdate ABC transporter ATP-binding protein n=1 Tax=Phenylobacterium sp. TaxID=1871053 RepID=UPI001B453B63|nr:sulfate/molybdate ABC transporter ATP-binding protein [Phenylobacterium sp.]MBP7649455.1 sulfate/molybdate ABC transporter ATP-binding protein [Phenylobacterium sp.]MBP7814926.1 sulfate/molybdate ABC transporter ATP-binding protein [Phenylobacterium sp.]MBP9231138.1 sulfate/molybdate ABC transporter ATP-binding protein [Phenylobacterium sp.]MBP9753735.1 sulfate/molybdate ABC transporter ATP-binding protein [Phenylobacterium sp.]
MTISIRSVEKTFGRYPALNGVSLEIADGELLALLGPSGSGKTTLLRAISGLEFPEKGQILFDGRDMTYASAAARQVGFVFQQYALFRHMTLARNIAFGLDVRKGAAKPPKAEIDKRVDDLLNLVELPGLGERYPAQLSGGQRQRVALARALAVSPSVLLLDEPFGALDATVRKSLRKELRRIHDATGVTTIFVTHDQEEALELADRVAILNKGVIEQVGTPQEVHDRPVGAFVAGFVGEANRLEGAVSASHFLGGEITLPAPGAVDGPAVAFVRPHDLVRAPAGEESFFITTDRINLQGPVVRIEGRTPGGLRIEAAFERNSAEGLRSGDKLGLTAQKVYVFSA